MSPTPKIGNGAGPTTSVLARAAVIVVGSIVLVAGALPAVSFAVSQISVGRDAGDPSAEAPDGGVSDAARHGQFECIRAQLVDQVAPGSVVHVPLDPLAFEADLWHQRLIEMVYPIATVVDEPEPGASTLTVVLTDPAVGAGADCSGVHLVVDRG